MKPKLFNKLLKFPENHQVQNAGNNHTAAADRLRINASSTQMPYINY